MGVLHDIIEKRGRSGIGHNPIRFIERFGAKEVPIMSYEPDPTTFRDEYYYNSRINVLFRKLPTDDDRVVWKRIGG